MFLMTICLSSGGGVEDDVDDDDDLDPRVDEYFPPRTINRMQ